ncbi:hypothetical protein F5Y13DRAFT_204160 [Hypoxylon sp. FL1857]|nr:hypothetical protein F5Y13DRAFT_204160 [Hypoxylon sp. FL1857]
MATVTSSWLDEAFKSAKEDFKRSLKNPALYDFSKITSIDDVLNEAKKIEKQQDKTKTLRGLKRIQPLIDGLKEYSGIIEVFAQAKPDVMSLIWGPLKFILQASSSVISAFEKVVKVIMDLGMTLPSFKIYAQLFQSNSDVRRALCLFYADVLDFYAILLNFLTNRRLNTFLESLWPNIRSNISKVQENIEHHKAMMVTSTYSAIRNEIDPHNHDVELADILRRSSVHSGEWLKDEPDFMRWLNTLDRTVRCIWLHGIPGSGKTFLVGNLIKRMQASGQQVLFAFLSHSNQAAGSAVRVFHSLLFQLLQGDPTFRATLHDSSQSNYRRLKNDSDFVLDFLCKILTGSGPSFIVLDGLDELDESSWKHLLSNILKINERCPETKLLISSREERDISLRLCSKAIPLRLDYRNFRDIDSFVQLECKDILLEMKSYGADEQICLKVKKTLDTIAEKAAGRLILLMVKDQGTLHDIEAQIEDLPDGLDEVYGRLLVRIKTKLTRSLRTVVRAILQWVACVRRPLREEEMLQILAVQPGQPDFTKGRKEFRDICKVCGPIVEINEGIIRFVHFSAKEYLLHEQSNNFLDLSEAHFDATLVYATYLSFSSLNSLFFSSRDEIHDIHQRILGGDYVMFEYASMAFLEHLKASLENQNGELDTRLVTTLSRLQETRSDGSTDISLVPRRFVHMFKSLAGTPNVQNCLSMVAYSQTKAQLGLHEEDDISIHDPLKVFSARRKFRQHLEGMICQESEHRLDCRCKELTPLYGTRLYHCDQHFCHAYRNGFESKLARDRHLGVHQRRHKCSIANCLFGEIGFHDTIELQRHMSSAHSPQISGEDTSHPSSISTIQALNWLDVLEDAIKSDQAELARELLLSRKQERGINPGKLLTLACCSASLDTITCLVDVFSDYNYGLSEALAAALETENLPIVKFLLSRGANMSSYAGTDYARHHIPRTRLDMTMAHSGYIRALRKIFYSPAIRGATADEAWSRFNGIKRYILWPEAYAEGAAYAAVGGSILSLRICLENGGNPNGSIVGGTPHHSIWRSALYCAVKLGTNKGAEIVRLLLQNGADPESEHSKGMKRLVGMREIEGCFGLTWGEVVRRIQAGEDLPITPIRKR